MGFIGNETPMLFVLLLLLILCDGFDCDVLGVSLANLTKMSLSSVSLRLNTVISSSTRFNSIGESFAIICSLIVVVVAAMLSLLTLSF